MKKYAFFALAAVLAAGCQTEMKDLSVANPNDVPQTFEASIDSEIPSKTALNGLNVVWSENDAITVFAGTPTNSKYQIVANGAGAAKATFSYVESGTASTTDILANVAVYPYAANLKINKYASSGVAYWMATNVNYPSYQVYAKDGVASNTLPMMAVNTDKTNGNFNFKNAAAILQLALKGDVTVKRITLSGGNNEYISGLATVYMYQDDSIQYNQYLNRQLDTLDCGEGVKLSESAATAFNIVVPPIAVNGFNATVYTTDGDAVTLSSDKVKGFRRNRIVKMPEKNISEDGVAALTSVSILAADNKTILTEDCKAGYIAPEMKINVPSSAMFKPLTITFGATVGDEITVNKTAIAGRKASNVDGSFPIDVVVTDKKTGKKASYVITIAEKIEYVVTEKVYKETNATSFGSYMDAIADGDNIITAYPRKVVTDGTTDKYTSIIVGKFDGSAFTPVGSSLGAPATRNASSPTLLKTSSALYVKYSGGEAPLTTRYTVQKYDGSAWTNTSGTTAATTVNNSTSLAPNLNPPFEVGGKIAFCFTGASSGKTAYRAMGMAVYDGESWTEKAVSASLPDYGLKTSSSGYFYTYDPVATADGVYAIASFNYYGYYVLKFNADLSVTKVVDDFLPAGEIYGVPSSNLAMRADKDGNLYVLAAISSKGLFQVYRVDVAKKEMKEFGSIIKTWPGTSGAVSGRPVMGISPKTGEFFLVMDDVATGLPVFSFMDENNQWAEFQPLSNVKASSLYEVVYTTDGTPTVVYMNTTDGVHYINVKEKE